jgi:glycosyltransferase involved in cell wall biosynthesis
MFIAVVVCFLNEERYLGVLLESILAQDRPPDRLVLVDDGSTDASADIASDFAQAHAAARLLRRPPRPLARDRMVSAPELSAFLWALDQIDDPYDVVAKMDADLRLTPDVIAEMERRFSAAGHRRHVPEHAGERR